MRDKLYLGSVWYQSIITRYLKRVKASQMGRREWIGKRKV